MIFIEISTNVNQIIVPLQTSSDQTKYTFIQNYNTEDTSKENEDKITLNYKRQDIYISRACGYKTVFNLNPIDGIIAETDNNNWINSIEVITNNIVIQDSAHVKIFH